MKLKKLMSIILAVSLAGGLAACGSGAKKEDSPGTQAGQTTQEAGQKEASIILTYAEVNPADSLDGQVGSFFKEQVESLSNGSVTIDIQASGVLGAENDVLDNMTAGGGTVDMARISCFALTNYGGKLFALPSVPFTFDNREHYWKFAESEMGQKILDEPSGLGLGVKGLFLMEEGFRHFFFNAEIKGIEDLKGKKIRVSSDPILTGVVDQLGASPTVISFNELYSSLQSGVVDGADQPTALYESNAFNEVAPYLIEDGHTMSASEVIITEDAWNKLSDGQKAAVSEAGKAAGQYCRELSSKIEEESKERLKEKGVTFIEVADKQPWKDACQSIISEYTAGYENEYKQIVNLK